GDASRVDRHLDAALRRERGRLQWFGSVVRDRDAQQLSGTRDLAVEQLDRVQHRCAEEVELLDERAAPLLQQAAALNRKLDPCSAGEQFAASRVDLLHHRSAPQAASRYPSGGVEIVATFT